MAQMKLDGKTFITLLGRTSNDDQVKALLAACGISRPPKLKRGELDEVLENRDLGIEIAFRDERYLDVKSKKYDEGALVFWSVNMYGSGHKRFKRFAGELPMDLSFDIKPDEAYARLGTNPSWQNEQRTLARWDRGDYCLFVSTDSSRERISDISVQLPVV